MSATMHIQGPQINQFNNISPRKIPRSAFKRDFTLRTTFNSDVLVPIFLDEILPGDQVSLSMTAQVRMTTPLKPLMDNLYYETFWFFIPMRLLWDNWEKFQGMQVNPGDSVAFTIPVLDYTKAPLSTTGFVNQSQYDYFGLPTLISAASGSQMAQLSALPFRAVRRIWNDWFRDENLQNSLSVATGNGPDDPATYTALLYRNNRKDYFMSCNPFAQKGTAVTLPTGTAATVKWQTGSSPDGIFLRSPTGTLLTGGGTQNLVQDTNAHFLGQAGAANAIIDPNNSLYADLTTSTPITINALRQAALYQQILELDARGGTRYVESIFSRFGVISPDFRLQRPELIGQGSTRINVYSVPQTAISGSTPQGNLAAFSATPIQQGHGCRYSATEHGMIIGLGNVRADLTYQQGIPKMFTRSTRLDFYEPLLNGLGEQAVLGAEIVADGTAVNDNSVFGYQERFSEYRFKNSMITGQFRSNDAQTQQIWHLSRVFAGAPVLNSATITSTTPMDRILAVNTATSPNFIMDSSFSYNHVRPMPIRSNPGIDRL